MVERLKAINKFINDADNFLITAHMNADGDAYASMLAMAYCLEYLNKKYHIVIHDEKIEDKYSFMWGFDQIQSFATFRGDKIEAAIVLDVPSRNRIGDPAKLLPSPENCVKIDHHPYEEDFSRYNLVKTEASSTSQLVYELVEYAGIPLSDELANLLFAGIMYDTGRFSFSNTSQRDFQIAAELLACQVKPSEIANRLFFDNSFQSMKTIGYGLANMESFLDGKLAIIFLPLHIMQQNHHTEIEELANYSVAIKDVEVGLFVREIKPGFFKVSFRSKGRANVNQIARAFGGGGHMHAAGCRYEGNFEELKEKLIQEVERHL